MHLASQMLPGGSDKSWIALCQGYHAYNLFLPVESCRLQVD